MGRRAGTCHRGLARLALAALLAAGSSWSWAERITAAVLNDFPPLYHLDDRSRPEGFAIDVLEAVARDAGLEVDYLPVRNWAEAMQAVRQGRADLVPGIGISEPRSGEFIFSSPMETVPVSWFIRTESTTIRTPADLRGRPVAALAESAAATRLAADGQVRLKTFDGQEAALFALLAGDVDALVFPQSVLLKKAREIGVAERLSVVGAPLLELKRGYLFRADAVRLRDRLAQSLQAFVGSPGYRDAYLKWYGTPEEFWSTARVFWSMLVLGGLLVTGILASRFVTVARLHRQLKDSEARYRAYVENAPEGIFVAEPGGRYLNVNASGCAMVGYSREELLERSIADLAPAGSGAEHQDLYETIKRTGSLTLELPLRRKDGSEVYVILRSIVLPDGNVMGLCADISDRRRQEAEITAIRNQLQATLDAIPDLLFELDREGRYLNYHSRRDDLLAAPAELLLGRTVSEMLPAEAAASCLAALEEAERSGYSTGRQLALDLADGRHWFELSVSRKLLEDGGLPRFILLSRDVTERRQAEEALRRQRETLQLILDYAPIGIWLQDGTGKLGFVNKAFCEATGIAESRFLAAPHYAELIPEAFRAQCLDSDAKALASSETSDTLQRLPFTDGRIHDLRVIKAVKRDAQGRPEALVGLSLDITEELAREQALRDSEERLRLALAAANQAWFELDLASGALSVSPEYPRMLGFDPGVFTSNLETWMANIHPDDQAAIQAAFRVCLQNGGPHTMDYRRRTANDGWKWIRSVGKIVQWDDQGRPTRMVGIHTDITQIKEHERQLEHIAHYDALTGLPNRLLLADRLHQAMAQAQRQGRRLAVAYLDLDGFKLINDDHGHDVGDRLLTTLAERMKHALREGDTLARLGGDEFVAVLLDLPDMEACVPLLARLLAAAAEQVQHKGYRLGVSASLGVTFFPQAEEVDADQLLRQADQAMYQAKLAGKNRYHVFDTEHDRTVRGHHESLERIRRGLADGEFLLHYQPKVNMRTGQVLGVEALIRWLHPERGLLPPALFLPVIDGHPLTIELGEWVMETAMTQIEAWKQAGLNLPVSVNVDAMQLQSPGFVASLAAMLDRHPGVGPGDLEVEVLETSALGDISLVARIMEACRELGVGFALDDFGTGYASLTYLKRLPAGLLKIDQSFVRNMLDDPDDLAILEGILGLAGAFRRQAIAEGVETAAHGEMLLRLGCEMAQGYQIARPMPAEAIPAWRGAWEAHPEWKHIHGISRDDLPLLFAAVELQAWVKHLLEYLAGERDATPPMDATRCRFGGWLAAQGRSRHGTDPVFTDVERMHLAIHTLADELADWRSRGRGREALARRGELEALRDALLAKLLGLV